LPHPGCRHRVEDAGLKGDLPVQIVPDFLDALQEFAAEVAVFVRGSFQGLQNGQDGLALSARQVGLVGFGIGQQ
jgi:hypothetical protein